MAAVMIVALAGCAASEPAPEVSGTDAPDPAPPDDNASPPTLPSGVEQAVENESLQVRTLHCGGEQSSAMESSFFGGCWGHIGHHTYFMADVPEVHAVAGRVFAVEIEDTTATATDLPVQTSLDGRQWETIGSVEYPLGTDSSHRYEIFFSFETEPTPARFLRIHMPPSIYEGLAGYLDASNFTLAVRPADGDFPEPEPRSTSDCADGLVDSFFDDHPCWFGGYDNIDRQTGGDPSGVHASWDWVDESWYDSPSFLHTHYMGSGVAGSMQATVEIQMWRMVHYGICSAGEPDAPVVPTVITQASPDGQQWATVAETDGAYDAPVAVEAELPPDTRFVRFGTERGASYDVGGCHHPVAFVANSSLSIAA